MNNATAAHPLLFEMPLLPLAQASFQVDLDSARLLLILLALGGYWGFQQGFRNMITITLWTIIAYLTTVQGGNIVVEILNRFWVNGPRLAAFALGRPVTEAPALDALITTDFQVPLFFRIVMFTVLVLLGFFFDRAATWRGAPREPLAKPLGFFAGVLVLQLWTNAAVVFWETFREQGGTLGGPVAQVLNTLPNVSNFLTSLIVIFFLVLMVLIVFNFPKVWKGDAGGGGGGGGGKR
ncbi:hypothetical protein [Candidatus Chloroploca asiatica]|uniref:Colicin V production protein n=1 Tax=Candidatus Chloroploca asiatica TaxID=1506545 RepID=A0A2H3KRR3_9CHLR|nr:hypothetical protein [Candidatus Chloroploca asiatica]PDW01302.1 hypothetical protein A9Q02_07675 [Candidatus Chloroploca asiatica]